MKTSTKIWIGRILGVLATLFLLFDAIVKVLRLKVATDSFAQLGYPPSVCLPIGLVLLVCVILYIIPRTSIFGAILLTGYLGGAVATNVRVGASFFGNILFPVYVAVAMWLALYFREERLRALVPLKK